MATKYSGSLDVSKELDEDEPKRSPVIDDSEDASEHSLEDDFNELIRRELGEPKKKAEPKKDITIEPVKEAPKIQEPDITIEKPAEKPRKPEKKIDVIKVEKKALEPKPIAKPAPKPKLVEKKPEPKNVTVKPEPKKVERHEPKAPKVEKVEKTSEPKKTKKDSPTPWSNRIITLVILILVAAGAVYAVNALRNGKDAAAMDCASDYVDDRGGISLAWSDASTVEQYWLRQAFESTSELEAARIFHMLACPDAFLSTLSDPSGYANCPTPPTYVIVDDQTVKDNAMAALDDQSILTKLNAGTGTKYFSLKYALDSPDVHAWEVHLNQTNATKKA
ncbi:MAG TPA: hypothetical protein VLJ21_03785 [Candidatus Binatia bacterium]|nr:hypothetical protein [Candidatus Binatia bacterium]